ncbi:helix-turn-helix domain-containing protein [Baia soyae]|uniref:Tetratricopeptide repeat protein n=1 Tax=Baia soyae TaxID=1544746 RepID=A0A4R2RXI6_9BACL|nr:tetratricopeptide repeat protein [Baia soyae]TCP63835.1 tetratricopeptide repeat protein [Baia soyae]
MSVFEISEIGKFIRKVRKERSLRLEDLSDEQISTATISNIERGVPHVNKEKVYYLMQKLGLNANDLPSMLMRDTENMETMQLKLMAIESMIRMDEHEKAYKKLCNISDATREEYASMFHSLRGRYFLKTSEWKKAERELIDSNRFISQENEVKNNLEAINFNYLAYLQYIQNDLQQALIYAERGLDVYREELVDPEQIKYVLMTNRVIYLEKLGKTDEALKRLDELWVYLPIVRKTEIILPMYALRADLYRRMKLYSDAIRYAREGIQIATTSSFYNEMFQIWTILGTIYVEQNNLNDAETCFSYILDLESRVAQKQELVRAYCSLGNLYLLQGKSDESKRILQQAISWAEKLNDALKLSNALIIMGRLMKTMGQQEEGVHYLVQAAQIAEQHDYSQKQFLACYELASCYDSIGDKKRFQEAIDQMYQAQRKVDQKQALFDVW